MFDDAGIAFKGIETEARIEDNGADAPAPEEYFNSSNGLMLAGGASVDSQLARLRARNSLTTGGIEKPPISSVMKST